MPQLQGAYVLIEALGIVIVLFLEHPFMTAILVVALEVPRYTVAIIAMGATRFSRQSPCHTVSTPITAIVPTHNGGERVCATLQSLLNQTVPLHQILVVDDGSTDQTRAILTKFLNNHPQIQLIAHQQRAGKSAAVNHAAFLATGDLLLIIDDDTLIDSTGCMHLAQAFDDPNVATVSGNLLINNRNRNPLTALQSLEYMLAMSIGRGFLSHLNAMSCCSGAFSMFRKDIFNAIGGLNVGPGEDLEITLRIRHAGYRVRFIDRAIAETTAPPTATALFKQRLRWDGDAVAIRLLMYREMSFFKKNEPIANSFQRLDYIFLELLPTVAFPFYLAALWIDYGTHAIDILIALYIVLMWLYLFNIILAVIITNRMLSWLDILALPVMPLYQGIVMRLVRFIAISDEIILSRSRHDPYVPEKVRQALYGDRTHG